MRARSLLLALVFLLGVVSFGIGPRVENAYAEEGWQYHLAQANNYYRNRLFPKALEELKLVVADTEGSKQLKAWQLIIEISGKMKELDTLIWGLEGGVAQASGQDAARMQAQLYGIKRIYGRVLFQVEGGSGKLPGRGLELKNSKDIADPEIESYYEKAVAVVGAEGYSVGSVWLPAGDYLLDGGPLKIVAGKDTVVEVAPTTDVTFAMELGGLGGGRFGDATTGGAGGVGGLQFLVGPHIRFASGVSLLVQVGPLLVLGAQSTIDIQQDTYTAHSDARVAAGGAAMIGLEFGVGNIDLAPRFGYAFQYVAPGLYYQGTVSSSPEGFPSSMLSGEFIVPAIAHGPRIGFQALVSRAVNERGKRVPRVFIGVHGGPLWATPQWGDLAPGSGVPAEPGTARGSSGGEQVQQLGSGPFTFISTTLGEDARLEPLVFVDLQAVIGLQFRP